MDATAREVLEQALRRAGGPGLHMVTATGRYRLRRVDRESGREAPTPWEYNTVTATGRNRFCRQVVGIDNAPMDQSATKLVLKAAGGATIKTLDATNNQGNPQAPTHSGRTVTWTFADISIDTYTVASVEIQRTGSPAYTFSTATPTFSGGNSKPVTQNWIYEYELTLNGGTAFDSPTTELPFEGLERMLRRFSGNTSEHWGAPRLNIYSSGWPGLGGPMPDYDAQIPSTTELLDVTDNVISWVFNTTGENMRWENVALVRPAATDQFLGWTHVGRTKTSPSTWEYTMTLTIN